MREILARLGLELHPEKTRRVELYDGKEGFDFLGCHLHKRMSGPIWEKDAERVYFLQRWPSQRAMKRVRQRVKELTPRSRCHADLRAVIADLNPVLRGWGDYFRTGNAARRIQPDSTPTSWRGCAACASSARAEPARRRSRALDARVLLRSLGLHRLRGHRPATRRPRNAATRETTGKPCAGNPHARFERGSCSHPVGRPRGESRIYQCPSVRLPPSRPASFVVALVATACSRTESASAVPRTADGKPNLQGVWQVRNNAAFGLEDHVARHGMPAGRSLVDGRTIPYLPDAATRRIELASNPQNDPLSKRDMPGVPRIIYLPLPFHIYQTPDHIAITFEWSQVHARFTPMACRGPRASTSGWATHAADGRATR